MLPYQTLPRRPALQTTDNRDSGRGRGAGDLRPAPTVCVASVSRAAPSDLRSPRGDLLHPGRARQFSGAGLWSPACPPGGLLELHSPDLDDPPARGRLQWRGVQGGGQRLSSGGRESVKQQLGAVGAAGGGPRPLPVPGPACGQRPAPRHRLPPRSGRAG